MDKVIRSGYIKYDWKLELLTQEEIVYVMKLTKWVTNFITFVIKSVRNEIKIIDMHQHYTYSSINIEC